MKASEFEFIFACIAGFLGGSFLVIVAIGAESAIMLFVTESLPALFLNALTEELLKFLALFAIVYVCNSFSREETLTIAGLIGFGFGFSENTLISAFVPATKAIEFISIRTIAPLPMHIIASAIAGFGLVKGKDDPKWIIIMFALAVLFHFCYNLFFTLM
jgi:RsiW-degrading membrane proteinase PrsW (M82 family)